MDMLPVERYMANCSELKDLSLRSNVSLRQDLI